MAVSRERCARWLRGELPGLVASGVISADAARALEQHYPVTRSRNIAFVLLATIGSALVAAGIILLVAHNWDMLSRPVRSLLAFLPLVGAQLLCVFVLLRRDDLQPWRESAAIFNVAGIGTAIALVSQTYQFHGSYASFLLTWLLLSIPIVYLMGTTLGAIAYLLGTINWIWVQETHRHGPGTLPFWLLLALVLPFVIAVH
ncbi:MAG TPA: DUF2157 domain-containing protein, partial [Chthoniobacterales bacterium]|nr:DUF2157 domain-containing protein [Chthoniobacterales bacterium]